MRTTINVKVTVVNNGIHVVDQIPVKDPDTEIIWSLEGPPNFVFDETKGIAWLPGVTGPAKPVRSNDNTWILTDDWTKHQRIAYGYTITVKDKNTNTRFQKDPEVLNDPTGHDTRPPHPKPKDR
jgi:hypothetical protein